jgi:hypothetical protein
VDPLVAASVDEILQFVRYLVVPRKAEGKRLAFTIAAEGDRQTRRIELRNGVLVITPADAKGSPHVDVTRRELAELVLGVGLPAMGRDVRAQFDAVLDRSHLMITPPRSPNTVERSGSAKSSDDLEH